MAVGCLVADVVEMEVEEAVLAGAGNHRNIERTPEGLREEGEDVDAHG